MDGPRIRYGCGCQMMDGNVDNQPEDDLWTNPELCTNVVQDEVMSQGTWREPEIDGLWTDHGPLMNRGVTEVTACVPACVPAFGEYGHSYS